MKNKVIIVAMAMLGLMTFAGCTVTGIQPETGAVASTDAATTDSTTVTDETEGGDTASTEVVNENRHKVPHITIDEIDLSQCLISQGDYNNLEVEVAKNVVTDEDVDNIINELLASMATMETVEDRALKNGDTANINFVGKINGEAFEGGTDDSEAGYDLVIGSGTFIPGFEEALIGMNTGETKDIDVIFPSTYGEASLAGKPAVFTVTLNSIKVEKVPELTDDFVKESGLEDVSTVQELKELARKSLEENAEEDYNTQIESAILDKLLEITEFSEELPEGRYQYYYDKKYDSDEQIANEYGIMLEGYVMYRYGYSDLNAYDEAVKIYANNYTKLDIAILGVLNNENMVITEEDVNKDIEDNYASHGYESAEALKEADTDNEYRTYLMRRRVVDLIKENVSVVEPK